MEGVAARAGVGKTTVYRWWPSKSALVLEAVGGREAPLPEPSGDLRADLRTAMEATLSSLRAPFADTLLALAGDLPHDPSAEAGPLRIFSVAGDGGDAMIRAAADRGELPADVDAPLLQDIYTGTLLYRVLCGRPTQGVVEKLLDLLLDGAVPRRAQGEGA
jgi:AcrR family transcriptional regulator